jgi:hypothetical protein
MSANKELLFDKNIKLAHEPVDMNTAAITGARIAMGKITGRVAIVCVMGDSTGATVQFTLKQHNASTGGTSKVLAVDNNYFKKVGAATYFTKVEPTAEASLYDLSADFAAEPGVVVFEVLPEQLDTNGGFNHLSVDVADSGAAKLLSTIYVVDESAFAPGYAEAL